MGVSPVADRVGPERTRYLEGLAARFEIPVELFEIPGSSVVPEAERRATGRVSHLHIGRRSLIWTDPDLLGDLSRWSTRATAIGFDEFRTWAVGHGAVLLGHGLEHLLPGFIRPVVGASQLSVLDGESSAGIETVRTLLDECSEDDLDEAEFDLDALDPYLVGWIEDGRLRALAGGRPDGDRPGCMDIGVLVHHEARRVGCGRAVVHAVADAIRDAGHVALYRCGSGNVGSQRLCLSVGFELVLELDGFQWPADLAPQ